MNREELNGLTICLDSILNELDAIMAEESKFSKAMVDVSGMAIPPAVAKILFKVIEGRGVVVKSIQKIDAILAILVQLAKRQWEQRDRLMEIMNEVDKQVKTESIPKELKWKGLTSEEDMREAPELGSMIGGIPVKEGDDEDSGND